MSSDTKPVEFQPGSPLFDGADAWNAAVPSSHVSDQPSVPSDRATLVDRCVQLLAIKVKELAYQMSREDVEAATTDLNRHQREAAKETAHEFEAAVGALASMAAAVHQEAPEPNQSKADAERCFRTWGLPGGYLAAFMAGAARPSESILREALARLVAVLSRGNQDFPEYTDWLEFHHAMRAARSALAGIPR